MMEVDDQQMEGLSLLIMQLPLLVAVATIQLRFVVAAVIVVAFRVPVFMSLCCCILFRDQ